MLGMSLRLNLIAAHISDTLERAGHVAFPVASTAVWRYRPYKDVPSPFIADLSHRHMAAGAGLGEFGWNGLLMTPEFGPRVRLATVITTARLIPTPVYTGEPLCDRCMRCVRECGKHIEGLTKEVRGTVKIEIGGKKFPIPDPQCCPDCRRQRRLSFRNERYLYRRDCELCDKSFISIFPAEPSLVVPGVRHECERRRETNRT